MNTPADLSYTDTHEWVRIENDEAVLGITEYAQHTLGDITYVELPSVGDTLTEGAEMGTVESVKAASDLFSPVSGTVTAVNEELADHPDLVNQAPYEGGWMVRVALSGRPSGLLNAADYEKLCQE
ncbi:MAG TPA: glycine cleavage system protein GcvH [Candidatus Mailhella merdigallinarum]|uniref:Glycine cleavage system H protein n=1 Tax=Candidatus Mailhella merdigallinarum TaxID=2838658 RepID=A0A9D2KN78_9BACT|nr:MAG: glycine cleavage system protein GcvH [Desulfovibrionaceae bacterium]HJA09318.1 glycine cleavage system protein GcvH [Candidatus Mailhella merdigallinarum]